MTGFWICVWLFQGSEYARFLRMRVLHKVLNMSEFGWIMPFGRVLNIPPQYDWIALNMTEYAGIYLKNQHREYARILNVSDSVHSIRSLYKLLSSYRDTDVFRTLSNIWDGAFCKKNIAWAQVHNQKFFRARRRGEAVKLVHLDKYFVKNARKKKPHRKTF